MADKQAGYKSVLKKMGIPDDVKDWVPDVDLVLKTPGIILDKYQDLKGNKVADGPFSMDHATCKNGAMISDQALKQVILDLQKGEKTSETSNSYTFDGSNPIARACKAAAKKR